MKKLLLIGPLIVVVICALFNIIAYASIGTVGNELYTIAQKTDQIEAQNKKMIGQLATMRSLSRSLEYAKTTGFVHASTLTQVVSKDTKVAMDSQ